MISAFLLALASVSAPAASYDALVKQAVAEAAEGRREDAARTLDRAVALAPDRPEARLERGGLFFLERRYDDAIDDLQVAVRARPDDQYARNLLASALLLTCRGEPAIANWNAIGKPQLRRVQIVGLRHARDAAVRREIVAREGERLEVDDYRRTRLRLEESGLFSTVTLRPLVTSPGAVDLEVALLERHGFGPIPELVGRGVSDLIFRQRVRLRYANLGGEGISIGAEYKWQDTQPFAGLTVDLLRPLGFPGTVRLEGLRTKPLYDLEDGTGAFRMTSRGGGIRFRSVIGSTTAMQAGLRYRERAFDRSHPDAIGGTIAGLDLGLDHTFWSGRRHALKGSARMLSSPFDGDVTFTRAIARLVHHLHVQRPDGLPLEHGSIAAQVTIGRGTDGTPIDEMFAPGTSSESDLPLRAHRQKYDGVLGRTPIARSIALANVEWRQRFIRRKEFQAGYVLFYDGGWMRRTARGVDETLHDAGVGVRIGIRERLLLRADWGHGLTDGKNALTFGLGQVF